MTLLPVNWSGRVTFRSALDGRVSNGGVARYRGLASRHLVPIEARAEDSEIILLAGRDQPVAHSGRRGRADPAASRRRGRRAGDHGDPGTGL